mgnify:CR=1 FL=1
METDLSISFNEAKHLVRQQYLLTLSNTYANENVNDLAEEVNEKYKDSLKHNYLLVAGLAKELETIKDRQEQKRNAAYKREMEAKAMDMQMRAKLIVIQNNVSIILADLKTSPTITTPKIEESQLATPAPNPQT